MKKFVFSLQSVYEYKQTVEQTQKADLKKAQAALKELLTQRQRLETAFEDAVQSLDKALKENIQVVEALKEHDAYFLFLKESRETLDIQIEKAQQEKDMRQAILIKTMKEVKTYAKLKEEQYKRYLEELRKEEAKDIGDLISYKTATQEVE